MFIDVNGTSKELIVSSDAKRAMANKLASCSTEVAILELVIAKRLTHSWCKSAWPNSWAHSTFLENSV